MGKLCGTMGIAWKMLMSFVVVDISKPIQRGIKLNLIDRWEGVEKSIKDCSKRLPRRNVKGGE